MPTCQNAKSVPTSHFYVPTCQRANKRVNVQHVKKRANFSTLPAEMLANFSKTFQKDKKIEHKMMFRHLVVKTLSSTLDVVSNGARGINQTIIRLV